MRKLLLLTYIFPVVILKKEETIIDNNDSIVIDSLKVMRRDSTLVNGKVNYKYENGQLKAEATYKGRKKMNFKRIYSFFLI